MPIACRLMRFATIDVVPDPMKGSRTVSPLFVNSLINHSGNASPLFPHCQNQFDDGNAAFPVHNFLGDVHGTWKGRKHGKGGWGRRIRTLTLRARI